MGRYECPSGIFILGNNESLLKSRKLVDLLVEICVAHLYEYIVPKISFHSVRGSTSVFYYTENVYHTEFFTFFPLLFR